MVCAEMGSATLFRSSLFFSLFFKRKGGCDRGAHFFSNPISANCVFGHFGVMTTRKDEQRQRCIEPREGRTATTTATTSATSNKQGWKTT